MDLLTTPGKPRRATFSFAVILAVGALVGIGGAWAKGALGESEITTCLDANGYLYQPPGGGTCRAGTLTWNQTGPQGPAGPPGPKGLPGAAAQVSIATRSLENEAIQIEQNASFGTKINNLQAYTSLCPPGLQAVGGGYSIASAVPPDLEIVTNQEFKLKGRSGWSVVLPRRKGFTARKLSVQAICVETS